MAGRGRQHSSCVPSQTKRVPRPRIGVDGSSALGSNPRCSKVEAAGQPARQPGSKQGNRTHTRSAQTNALASAQPLGTTGRQIRCAAAVGCVFLPVCVWCAFTLVPTKCSKIAVQSLYKTLLALASASVCQRTGIAALRPTAAPPQLHPIVTSTLKYSDNETNSGPSPASTAHATSSASVDRIMLSGTARTKK